MVVKLRVSSHCLWVLDAAGSLELAGWCHISSASILFNRSTYFFKVQQKNSRYSSIYFTGYSAVNKSMGRRLCTYFIYSCALSCPSSGLQLVRAAHMNSVVSELRPEDLSDRTRGCIGTNRGTTRYDGATGRHYFVGGNNTQVRQTPTSKSEYKCR